MNPKDNTLASAEQLLTEKFLAAKNWEEQQRLNSLLNSLKAIERELVSDDGRAPVFELYDENNPAHSACPPLAISDWQQSNDVTGALAEWMEEP